MKDAFEYYLEGTLVEHEESFWKAVINCPVEIAIFNSTGEQIGFISDDECWYSETLKIKRQGNIKEIHMLVDEVPTFVITATDYGTMNCCFEESDDVYTTMARVLFYDVPLAPDKTFEITLVDDLRTNADNVVMYSGEETLDSDKYVSVENKTSVSISCTVNIADGGSVHGTGIYACGDVATLYAEANEGYEFVGWYENDVLINESLVYEFITGDNRTLTARFAEITTVCVDVYDGNGGTSIGEGIFAQNSYVTLIAFAEDGYAFNGWYFDDKLMSNSVEYTFVAVNDIKLEARFIKHTHSFDTPQFAWKDDYSCSATFTCTACDYGKTLACAVEYAVDKITSATSGVLSYTATIEWLGEIYKVYLMHLK